VGILWEHGHLHGDGYKILIWFFLLLFESSVCVDLKWVQVWRLTLNGQVDFMFFVDLFWFFHGNSIKLIY
jgi:hypothetical protein